MKSEYYNTRESNGNLHNDKGQIRDTYNYQSKEIIYFYEIFTCKYIFCSFLRINLYFDRTTKYFQKKKYIFALIIFFRKHLFIPTRIVTMSR